MLTANTDNIGILFQRMKDIKIISTPLSPFDLIVINHWQIATYHIFSRVMKTTTENLVRTMSPRSFTFYSPTQKNYFIVYNSDLLPAAIRFNLAHEIGHIFHGHVSEEQTLMCTKDSEKLIRDTLADQFAREILSAEQEQRI